MLILIVAEYIVYLCNFFPLLLPQETLLRTKIVQTEIQPRDLCFLRHILKLKHFKDETEQKPAKEIFYRNKAATSSKF